MKPNNKNDTDNKIKKKETKISNLVFLKNNKAGTINKEIQIKLKE
jgi:hypothetical protein